MVRLLLDLGNPRTILTVMPPLAAALAAFVTGPGKPAHRSFAAWMLFTAALSTVSAGAASGHDGRFWYGVYGYLTLAACGAIVWFATTLPWLGKRVPHRSAWVILALTVALELLYGVDHCTEYCLTSGGELYVGPLGWAELFVPLAGGIGLVFAAVDGGTLRRPALGLFAVALLAFCLWDSTRDLVPWVLPTRSQSGVFAPSQWTWTLTLAQTFGIVPAVFGFGLMIWRAPTLAWRLGVGLVAAAALASALVGPLAGYQAAWLPYAGTAWRGGVPVFGLRALFQGFRRETPAAKAPLQDVVA